MEKSEYVYLDKCNASKAFEKFISRKGFDKAVFNDAIRVIDAADFKFDFYNIDKADSCLRFGNKQLSQSRGKRAGQFLFEKGKLVLHFAKTFGRKSSKRVPLSGDIKQNERLIIEALAAEMSVFADNNLLGSGYWPSDYNGVDDVDEDDVNESSVTKDDEMMQFSPLNQIFYGPPGTGKTFYTIEAAVKAAEPKFSWSSRNELKQQYDKLVKDERIRFVTFHQSYGYEEFVEGLKARETDNGDVTFVTESGVFKRICEAAARVEVDADSGINLEGQVWKLSIEGTRTNAAKTHCLEHNIGAIGWGKTGDLSSDERNDYFQSQGKNNQNSLTYFSQAMSEGDLVLCIDSNTSVEAVGVVTGGYQYVQSGIPSRADYCHQIPIKWLAKGFSVGFKTLNGNKQFSLPTCYPLSRISVSDALKHLAEHKVKLAVDTPRNSQPNYVLIIDEINRGNISKIFGELITLIEPSKRVSGDDNDEGITVTLPYSGKSFSVPKNLFLIGTMNTADRSLAMMDTALRRRFDFIEMMPDPSKLAGKSVKGIELERLLKTLNQRIECLYDREHTLGHAFFMPVVAQLQNEDAAFIELQQVFKNKIIPLLEEYFFDDWNKIRLVLYQSALISTHFGPASRA